MGTAEPSVRIHPAPVRLRGGRCGLRALRCSARLSAERRTLALKARATDGRSAQCAVGVGLDGGPLLHQVVEPLIRARADFLIGLADLPTYVPQPTDEPLVFV